MTSPIHFDLLFPPRLIPTLSDLRGKTWQALVDQVWGAEPDSLERITFILLMTRLSGCASCTMDSYRALQGCQECSRQALRRFRGSDEELQNMYQTALHEVQAHFEHKGLSPSQGIPLKEKG